MISLSPFGQEHNFIACRGRLILRHTTAKTPSRAFSCNLSSSSHVKRSQPLSPCGRLTSGGISLALFLLFHFGVQYFYILRLNPAFWVCGRFCLFIFVSGLLCVCVCVHCFHVWCSNVLKVLAFKLFLLPPSFPHANTPPPPNFSHCFNFAKGGCFQSKQLCFTKILCWLGRR